MVALDQLNIRQFTQCSPSKRSLAICFATAAIVGRVGYYIVTPLWLDFFAKHDTNSSNETFPTLAPSGNATVQPREISVFFVLLAQWLMATLFYGFILIMILICAPRRITEVERTYPKKSFLIIGVTQGISSLLFNSAVSGSRTAPYLQAVLSNCNIPIQFVIRFLVLRKRPTLVKVGCAVAVVLAEFVCLLPKIFPSLENSSAHQAEGGSSGVLWPMCMVLSMVPFAVANSVMERSVQHKEAGSGPKAGSLNLVYFLFWFNLFTLATVCVFFWADILPGFGTSENIHQFGKTFVFDLACTFGQRGCGGEVVGLAWANFFFNIVGLLAFAGLMRYSEGANFVIIVLTLRTPVLFIFWTLFEENPFHWHPHASLATWLSIGAITVMLPAIVIYDKSAPEVASSTVQSTHPHADREPDEIESRGLLSPEIQNYGSSGYASVNDTGSVN